PVCPTASLPYRHREPTPSPCVPTRRSSDLSVRHAASRIYLHRQGPRCGLMEDAACFGHYGINRKPDENAAVLSLTRQGGAIAPKDRKSTRLNSSHVKISYAVFCFEKN